MKQLIKDIKEGQIVEGIGRFYHRRHLPLIAYLILASAVALAFYFNTQERSQRRADIARGIAINCERLNNISDQNAARIYTSWKELDQNAELLGINLTRAAKEKIRLTDNETLKDLRYYDCTIPPYQPQKFVNYKPIVEGQPVPTVPDRNGK